MAITWICESTLNRKSGLDCNVHSRGRVQIVYFCIFMQNRPLFGSLSECHQRTLQQGLAAPTAAKTRYYEK